MEQEDKQDTPLTYEQVVAEVAKAKADPTYKPQLPEGYVIDAEFPDGVYRVRPCIEEFMSHGYKREQYEARFGGEVIAGKEAWGPPWSNPAWQAPPPDGLPDTLHVVSQVRRVGTRTVRATSPTRHRFKQYLFGNPSHRLVRNGKLEIHTNKVLNNLDELIAKEGQGLLSVHHKDGRRVNLQALKDGHGQEAFAQPRLASPPPNFALDSIVNDTASGIPMSQFIEGTFPGDPAAQRALDSMRSDKATESGEDSLDDFVDPAASDAQHTEAVTITENTSEDTALETTEVADGNADGEEPAADDAQDSVDTQPVTKSGKGNKKGGKR